MACQLRLWKRGCRRFYSGEPKEDAKGAIVLSAPEKCNGTFLFWLHQPLHFNVVLQSFLTKPLFICLKPTNIFNVQCNGWSNQIDTLNEGFSLEFLAVAWWYIYLGRCYDLAPAWFFPCSSCAFSFCLCPYCHVLQRSGSVHSTWK